MSYVNLEQLPNKELRAQLTSDNQSINSITNKDLLIESYKNSMESDKKAEAIYKIRLKKLYKIERDNPEKDSKIMPIVAFLEGSNDPEAVGLVDILEHAAIPMLPCKLMTTIVNVAKEKINLAKNDKLVKEVENLVHSIPDLKLSIETVNKGYQDFANSKQYTEFNQVLQNSQKTIDKIDRQLTVPKENATTVSNDLYSQLPKETVALIAEKLGENEKYFKLLVNNGMPAEKCLLVLKPHTKKRMDDINV